MRPRSAILSHLRQRRAESRRELITSRELKRLVEEDGLRGVTGNPTIFEKAIAETRDYDEALRKLLDARAGSYDRTLYRSAPN